MKENQNNRHDKEPAADSASVDVTEPAKSRYISETEWILLCIEIGMGLPTLVFFFRGRVTVCIARIGGEGQNEFSRFRCSCH